MVDLSVDEFLRTAAIPTQTNPSQVDQLSEQAIESGVNLAQAIGKAVNLVQPIVPKIDVAASLVKGVNLAQLVSNTYNSVELASHIKSHAKIDELEKHEKKLKTVTQFLTEIETQLSNPDARVVNMADKSSLVEEMHQLLDHKLLSKTEWTRAEAETIKTAMTRHSQVIMQQVHHSSSEVNRAIEEGTELLQIARKILEMYQQLITTFTRNQRGG